jgi:hypothetical protein
MRQESLIVYGRNVYRSAHYSLGKCGFGDRCQGREPHHEGSAETAVLH